MLAKIRRQVVRWCSHSLEEMTRRELMQNAWHCERVLDVGCGRSSVLGSFRDEIPVRVGVDIFAPAIEETLREKTHTQAHQLNVLDIAETFAENSFDAVIANDLLEHLSREDGLRLIAMMQRIARHKVLIFTPNGFVPQGEYDDNPHQKHLSGWTSQQLEDLGFDVVGLGGWKVLHGEGGQIRWKPRRLWSKISMLTRPWCHTHPQAAFHLFASWQKQR